MKNIEYKILQMPLPEDLFSGVRPIKVKNPDRERFNEELRITYSLKRSGYKDKNIDDQIEYNDVIELSSESNNRKFNAESIWITVGRNAFNANFEKEIIGLKVNDEKIFHIDNSNVHVKIKSITKKYYGSVTLEDVQIDFPKAESIDSFLKQQYDNKCAQLTADKVFTLLIPKLCCKLLEKTNIEFDENSLKRYITNQVELAGNVMIPESLSEEQKKAFDVTPIEAKVRRLESIDFYLNTFKGKRSVDEYKKLSLSEIDQILVDKLLEELRYKIVNIEFSQTVGFQVSMEDYHKLIAEEAIRHGMAADEFIKRSGYTYEMYSDYMREYFTYHYFDKYAYENLIIS